MARRALQAKGAAAAVAFAASLAAVAGVTPAAAQDLPRDDGSWLMKSDRFAPPSALIPTDAKTYDRKLVPAGAGIAVLERATAKRTFLALGVRGLPKNRQYG